jgi:GTP pyrophosphokinase
MNREEFFSKIEDKVSPEGLLLIQRAYWFAKNVHSWQERDDGGRYFEHPRRVVCTLIDLGIFDPETLVLAFIHDCMEDGFTPSGVILTLFGPTIYNNLLILSKKLPVFNEITGKVISWAKRDTKEYFAGIAAASTTVRLVKLADRRDNVGDMDSWKPDRVQEYLAETAEFLLPIARQTNDWFVGEFERIMDKQERRLSA